MEVQVEEVHNNSWVCTFCLCKCTSWQLSHMQLTCLTMIRVEVAAGIMNAHLDASFKKLAQKPDQLASLTKGPPEIRQFSK